MDSHTELSVSALGRIALTAGLSCFFPAVGSAQCQLDKIYAIGSDPCEQFGMGLDMDGDRLVVGAHSADDDPAQPCATGNTGAAYVFERVGSSWIQTQRLLASDGGPDDEFGNSVAVSGDRIIVGAEYHDGAGITHSGAAYVFELQDSTWVQVAKLRAPDGYEEHYFARSVDIAGDLALCGTRFDEDLGYRAGAVYLYERDESGAWGWTQKLLAGDGAAYDLFGNAVATDGTWIVSGAYWKNGAGGEHAGAVYVYGYEDSEWLQTAKLEASDQEENAEFGRSVAVDGNRILVGAVKDEGSGSAYVFELQDDVWVETAKLIPSDAQYNDKFGESCAIEGDYAIVGSKNGNGSANTGAVYLFHHQDGAWVETAILTPIDTATQNKFGYNCAMSGDVVVGGAPFDGSFAGTAAVFSISGACAASPYGTEVNAPGSLIHLSGSPTLGSTMTFGVDNPYGTQGPGSTPFLFVSAASHPAFPMGGTLESKGMAGPEAPCEVLIAPYLVAFTGPPWTGPGDHAVIEVEIPDNAHLIGFTAYLQGALIDPVAANGVEAGCTTAMFFTITE